MFTPTIVYETASVLLTWSGGTGEAWDKLRDRVSSDDFAHYQQVCARFALSQCAQGGHEPKLGLERFARMHELDPDWVRLVYAEEVVMHAAREL